MTDKNEERDAHETTVASKAFLEGIVDLMRKHEIQPGLAFSLFGYFARNVVRYEVEELGNDHDVVTLATLQAFTAGLGVKGGFVEMKGEAAAQMRAQFERQNDDKPLQ